MIGFLQSRKSAAYLVEQVLAYARTRYVGRSDWERTDRQRSVVTKIFNKLRTSDLPTLYNFANAAFPLFKTDLSNTEILRYVYTVITNRMTITQSKRIPVDGTYTQEIKEETLNVLVPKLEPNAQALQKFVYGYSNVEVEENHKREEAKKNAKKNDFMTVSKHPACSFPQAGFFI